MPSAQSSDYLTSYNNIHITDIIFDYSGVLSPRNFDYITNRLSKKHEIDKNSLFKFMEKTEKKYLTRKNDSEFFKEISKTFNIKEKEIKEEFSVPTNETFLFAKHLSKQGYNVSILSNMINFRTSEIRKNHNLSFFKKTFFSNEIHAAKPSKKIFELCIKELNTTPKECLFIDDTKENIESAKTLGINTIHYKSLKQLRRELKKFGVSTGFILEESSGGIVIHDKKIIILKDNPNTIEFPKGHIEKGETELQAAYREIFEEAEIQKKDLKHIEKLGTFIRRDLTSRNWKKIHMHLFEYKNINKENLTKNVLLESSEEVSKLVSIKEDREFYKKHKFIVDNYIKNI